MPKRKKVAIKKYLDKAIYQFPHEVMKQKIYLLGA